MKKILWFLIPVLFLASPYSYSLSVLNGGDAVATDQINANRIVNFSKKVEKYLADNKVLVALVARQGRDPKELPEGIDYTHVGFWVYSNITLENGKKVNGYVSHNLYQREKETNVSDLINDYPITS